MIIYYVKKGTDISKYGFVREKNYNHCWVLINRYWLLKVNDEDMRLCFNIPTNDELLVFAQMYKDNVLITKEYYDEKIKRYERKIAYYQNKRNKAQKKSE